jgi:hypothetical protein
MWTPLAGVRRPGSRGCPSDIAWIYSLTRGERKRQKVGCAAAQPYRRTKIKHFADGIRVEHEIHRRNASTLTNSSGIRGISQLVVPRTESSHALSFFMRWRAVPLRHQGWVRRVFTAVPLACRASSQPNNCRAWEADNFLTFLTACSTALMRHKLPGETGRRQARFICLDDRTKQGFLIPRFKVTPRFTQN